MLVAMLLAGVSLVVDVCLKTMRHPELEQIIKLWDGAWKWPASILCCQSADNQTWSLSHRAGAMLRELTGQKEHESKTKTKSSPQV